MFFSLAASPICFSSNGLGTLLYPSYSAAAIAWRPRPIPHAKWRLSGKGLVSAGKGHVLVHDFMDNE